jgi:hypothetical protein
MFRPSNKMHGMRKTHLCVVTGLLAFALGSQGQVKRSSVPLGDAIEKALGKCSLTYGEAHPFHIRIEVNEPENPQSPYQGVFEEWWLSNDKWRREVTDKGGLHQTVVMNNGISTEKDEGDYFPLWLRSFVFAAFDPVPDLDAFRKSGRTIEQITLPNGAQSAPTVNLKFKIGTGERATDAYADISFDREGRLTFYLEPRYGMEFHDFRSFGDKQIARVFVDHPEPGTELVGKVVVLEDASKTPSDLFQPLSTSDTRFRSVAVGSQEMESFTADEPIVEWPSVHSGNTSGHLAMYVSIDAQGQIREAWPLGSDNAGLEDPARDQVRKWKIKAPVDKAGKPLQIDGPLAFVFQSRIENPLPILTSKEDIDRQSIDCPYNPTLPNGILPAGQSFKIRIGVNEKGEQTGITFPPNVPWSVFQAAHITLQSCKFNPYVVHGQPTYYGIEYTYTAP